MFLHRPVGFLSYAIQVGFLSYIPSSTWVFFRRILLGVGVPLSSRDDRLVYVQLRWDLFPTLIAHALGLANKALQCSYFNHQREDFCAKLILINLDSS